MRQIIEGVSIAISSIRASKARASLTILGIAIGVMVVMVMSSMVRGINYGVANIIEQLGPRTFYVVKFFQNGVVTRRSDLLKNPALTEDEGERLARLPSVERLILEQQSQVSVEHDNQARVGWRRMVATYFRADRLRISRNVHAPGPPSSTDRCPKSFLAK